MSYQPFDYPSSLTPYAPIKPKGDVKDLYEERVKEYADFSFVEKAVEDLTDEVRLNEILGARRNALRQLDKLSISIEKEKNNEEQIGKNYQSFIGMLNKINEGSLNDGDVIKQADFQNYLGRKNKQRTSPR